MSSRALPWPAAGLALAALACSLAGTPTPGPYTLTLVPADGLTAAPEMLEAAATVINERLSSAPSWGAQAEASAGGIVIRYADPDAAATIAARATAVGALTLVGSDRQRVAGDPCPDGEPVITNADIDGAQVSDSNGQWAVAFTLTDAGATRFATYTSDHVGEVLAICRDGLVLSAPVINGPITGGEGVISGSFSQAEVEQIAAELSAGALPIPLEVLAAEQ